MKFWGVEVKAGKPLEVESGEFLLHISQASLGEAKKDKANESVYLNLNVDGKKLVLGTLSFDKFPQISMDLVFDRDFKLSHNWKHGNVYFTGYRVPKDDVTAGESSDSGTDDEIVPLPVAVNHGKKETNNVQVKPGSSESKKVKTVEPVKDEEDDDSSDEVDDDSSDDQDESEEDEEERDGEDDDSDEQAKEMAKKKLDLKNKKKKRAGESSVKTPVPNKKAKLVTPQKTEEKTPGGRVATPFPSSKQASKATASISGDQKKDQIAKPFTCKPCNKSFGSDNALQSHNKAKHSS